jgi:hypothetical protein
VKSEDFDDASGVDTWTALRHMACITFHDVLREDLQAERRFDVVKSEKFGDAGWSVRHC